MQPADLLAMLTLDIYFRGVRQRPAMYGLDPNWDPETGGKAPWARQFNPLGVKSYSPLTDAWDAQGFTGLGKIGGVMGKYVRTIPSRYAEALQEGDVEGAMRAGLEAYYVVRIAQHAPGQVRGLVRGGTALARGGARLVVVGWRVGQRVFLRVTQVLERGAVLSSGVPIQQLLEVSAEAATALRDALRDGKTITEIQQILQDVKGGSTRPSGTLVQDLLRAVQEGGAHGRGHRPRAGAAVV